MGAAQQSNKNEKFALSCFLNFHIWYSENIRKGNNMKAYDLYLANVRGQKITGFYRYYSNSFNEARAQFRKDKPTFDYLNVEILAAV